MKRGLAGFAAALAVATVPEAAEAARAGVECTLIEDDVIDVDGMLDDWEGVRVREAGGFEVRCAHSGSKLYLVIGVDDDTVIRTSAKPNNPKQDRLRGKIGAGGSWSRFDVLPGTRGFESVRTWQGKAPSGDVAMEDAAQQTGWAVEIAVPLERLGGWGRGTPKLAYSIEYQDRDSSGRSTAKLAGTIRFAGATDAYRGFMRQTGLSRSDVKLDKLVDLDGERGVERLIVGGRFVGVLTLAYSYLTLPVQSEDDLLSVQAVPLDGGTRHFVVTSYREHGGGGSRDVVAVWALAGNGSFNRVLAVEVRKQYGGNSLANQWRFERRTGKRGKKLPGQQLVVEAGEVVGWDEDSFDDVPPEDMRPILTPWAEQTRAVYTFENGQAFGGGPPE